MQSARIHNERYSGTNCKSKDRGRDYQRKNGLTECERDNKKAERMGRDYKKEERELRPNETEAKRMGRDYNGKKGRGNWGETKKEANRLRRQRKGEEKVEGNVGRDK